MDAAQHTQKFLKSIHEIETTEQKFHVPYRTQHGFIIEVFELFSSLLATCGFILLQTTALQFSVSFPSLLAV